MKKNRILKGLIICMLMVMCFCTTVFADVKIKNGKTNKWLPGKRTEIYKIRIPAGVYIQSQVKKGADVSMYSVYKGVNRKSNKYIGYRENGEYFFLPKGTYYFYTGGYKFRLVTKKAQKNYDNYCFKKARSLSAGKLVVVIQTPTDSYVRWYKIKIKKKKRICLQATGMNSFSNAVSIRNSDGELLDITTDDYVKYWTLTAQPAGTYYISLGNEYEYYEEYEADKFFYGRVYTLKWK